MNGVKTVLLMGMLTGLFVIVGDLMGGTMGMIMALALAAGMNLIGYWYSDKIVLAMYRARPVDEASAPGLYRIVRRLAVRAELPMPAVYMIPTTSPNAFATGRNPRHAAVAVTEGLARMLSEDELEGVLAHELAHVSNRDVLVGTIAATLAGALMIMVRIFGYGAMIFGGRDRGGGLLALLMLIVAPLAALLIQMAISRSREYQADADAARLSGNPKALARALAKLQSASAAVPMDANPSTAHMFIVNPLSGQSLVKMFSTHPPINERIARLEAMERRG